MKVELKPTSQITARLGINPDGKVQKFFTDTCANRMDKYVPIDTGMLSTIIDKGQDYITYESIYARYQYKGISKSGKPLDYSNSHEKHPYAGDYWDKRMVSAEMEDLIKDVQRYVNKRG